MTTRFFSYEGDHAEVESYGLHFPQGVPVPVEDAFALQKLEGNNHFREHVEVTGTGSVVLAPAKRKYTRKAK